MMNVWNNAPVVALSWVDDDKILFGRNYRVYLHSASGNNLFYCDLPGEKIRTVAAFSPEQSVSRIISHQNFLQCQCISDGQLRIRQELGEKLVYVFGNRLCKVFSQSDSSGFKIMYDIPTNDFICGFSVLKKANGYLLYAVSINGSVKIYCSLSSHLLKTICITNSSMFYCTKIVNCFCVNGCSLICAGGTSSCICVWSFNGEAPFNIFTLSNLGAQKGIVYAVDMFKRLHSESLLLASAAEDRSIVIWSTPFDSLCSGRQFLFTKWSVLHRLDSYFSNNFSSLLFESRIWSVQMNDWGISAAGEDCSVICCPWPKSSTGYLEPVLLKSVHRGRSIWCLDTRLDVCTNMKIVSGGNDGALIVNELDVNPINKSSTASVKTISQIPKNICPSPFAKNTFPSDSVYSGAHFVQGLCALFQSAAGGSVLASSALRELFIGPEGKIFTIFESGDIALLCSSDDSTPELTPVRPFLSPTLSRRVSKDAPFIQEDGVHLRQGCLFPGFCVSGVHRESRKFALGGRWGCLGVYEIVPEGGGEADGVSCLDLINLPPFQRLAFLQWISKHELVVGMYPLITVYICLNDSNSEDDGLFRNIFYLERPSCDYKGEDLAWTTCADGCFIQELDSIRCILIGTRSGGIGLYVLSSNSKLDSIKPSWYFDQCHGREGVTAVKIVHNSIAITAGRQYGRIRRWRIITRFRDLSGIGLQPLDQILKPSSIPWIGSFATLPSGTVLALGFISTKFLAAEILPPGGENLISEAGVIHFTLECGGGHRAWDFAHDSLDDSFTFAAIQKNSLLFARQQVEKTPSLRGFKCKSLMPSLHGRDINTCFMIPLNGTNICDGFVITCYTGSEEVCLGSFPLEVRSDLMSGGPTVSYYKSIGPTFHTGHISNIRCLTSVNTYLISGGGRGMLAVWRLDSAHINQPGLIGRISLDTGVQDFCPLYSRTLEKKRNPNGICDLRIMALLAFQEKEEIIFVIAGCSDGSIRLIKVYLPCEDTGWIPKFYQLCDLRRGFKRACVLSLCELSSVVEHCVSIAYTNTAGTVAGLEVDLQNGALLNRTFSLQLGVENPVTKTMTPCAANSVVALKNLIVVAGDDGSLRLADLKKEWITKVIKHFAAVVKIISLDKQRHLLSLGADHRMLLWRLTDDNELSVVSELKLAGLGDPQNISVIQIHGSTKEFLAMICGSGVQLYHFKL